MLVYGSNKSKRFLTVIISLVVLLALFVSMAGAFAESDCDDDCADKPGACCECVCCPTKVVMNVKEEISLLSEYAKLLCTVERVVHSGERVWFGSIDHPPQNQA